jgi:hypothetical protein
LRSATFPPGEGFGREDCAGKLKHRLAKKVLLITGGKPPYTSSVKNQRFLTPSPQGEGLRGRLLGESQMLRREERLVGMPGWNIHRNGGTRVGAAFFWIDYGSLDFT